MRKTVYLSLGSNMGARAVNLEMAISRLEELGRVTNVSSFYETEPLEVVGQPTFLNCVVELTTERLPKQLMSAILHIEREMGRKRTVAKGPRNIDIDVVLFGNSIIDSTELTVPHPAMHTRRFVLEPLVEINPDVLHPVFKKSARQLLDAVPPGQKVKKIKKA